MADQASDHETCLQRLLEYAQKKGASAAEACIAHGLGFTNTVRQGALETIEQHQEQGLSINVYFGQRSGSASSSDLSEQALLETVHAACDIAKYTQKDPCSGLANPAELATKWPELQLYHPWDITPEQATELAQQGEAAGLAIKQIKASDGVSVSTGTSRRTYANSHGFLDSLNSSYHSIHSCFIAEDSQHNMQRADDYSGCRDAKDLLASETISKQAALDAVAQLSPQKIPTGAMPVIFLSPVAKSLIRTFLAAIHGGNLYRQNSVLSDQMGQLIFPPWLSIVEDPFVIKGLASSPYDHDGVTVKKRTLIDQGYLQGYLLNAYSARQLGLANTGNAGGAHNIFVSPQALSFQQLLKHMGRGLLVTDMIGDGINLLTGDYSRGASGFWIEQGDIQHPVEEITIAGNLKDMWQGIEAIANDNNPNGSIDCGSILINQMIVASC